jgi:predicted PurR-regulated permease PerM
MAGRIFGLFVNVIFIPIIAACVGYAILDPVGVKVNQMAHFPMDAINTFTWLRLIFAAGVFIFVLIVGINHMIQSQNEADQLV